MEQEQREQQFIQILKDFVKISSPLECSNCSNSTKLLGETRTNGGWFCPFCYNYTPYKSSQEISIETPFIKLTDQLDKTKIKKSGILLGDPVTANFPMDMTTGFLVPSYSSPYLINRKQNRLLAVAIDFTRFGRVKGTSVWEFDLGYDDRTVDEYETLLSFSETQGGHLPFNYTDPFRGSSHICYFDSDVSPAQPVSFDGVSFSVKISE